MAPKVSMKQAKKDLRPCQTSDLFRLFQHKHFPFKSAISQQQQKNGREKTGNSPNSQYWRFEKLATNILPSSVSPLLFIAILALHFERTDAKVKTETANPKTEPWCAIFSTFFSRDTYMLACFLTPTIWKTKSGATQTDKRPPNIQATAGTSATWPEAPAKTTADWQFADWPTRRRSTRW